MKKSGLLFLLCAAALSLLPSCASTACPEGSLKVGWGRRSIAMPGPVPITGRIRTE